MDAQMLLNGISRSLFATADDELRPVMNGVYFDIHTDTAKLRKRTNLCPSDATNVKSSVWISK